MDYLEQAKNDYQASVDGGNFELDAQGETPWYIHASDAVVNALIALVEEQQKANALLAAQVTTQSAMLDLATSVVARHYADVLANFTEHPVSCEGDEEQVIVGLG